MAKNKSLIFIIFILSINIFYTLYVANASKETKEFFLKSKITYMNRGEYLLKLDKQIRTFNVFINTSYQTTYILDIDKPYEKIIDVNGNPSVILYLPSISSGEEIEINIYLKIIKRDQEIPYININDSEDIYSIPDYLQKEYCISKDSWPTQDQNLINLANEIMSLYENTTNVMKIVCNLSSWIGKNIDSSSHEKPYYPNETIHYLEGDCDDQSNLLITLCRILGIPAYLQVGGLQRSERGLSNNWEGHKTLYLKYMVYHAWAVIYIPPWGWLPFDLTLGWNRTNPLDGITRSIFYKTSTIHLMNIIESDWIANELNEKKYFLNNSLYVHYEYELSTKPYKSINYVSQWLIWMRYIIALSIILVLFVFLIYFFYSIGYITRMPDLDKY